MARRVDAIDGFRAYAIIDVVAPGGELGSVRAFAAMRQRWGG